MAFKVTAARKKKFPARAKVLVPDNIWWLQNLSPYPEPVLETVTSLGRGSTTRVSIRKGHLTELRRGGGMGGAFQGHFCLQPAETLRHRL